MIKTTMALIAISVAALTSANLMGSATLSKILSDENQEMAFNLVDLPDAPASLFVSESDQKSTSAFSVSRAPEIGEPAFDPAYARHYVIEVSRLQLMGSSAPRPLQVIDNLAVVRMNERQYRHLQNVLHNGTFSCGGAMDIEWEVRNRTFNLQSLRSNVSRAQLLPGNFPVNPSYPKFVAHAMNQLKAERYAQTLTSLTQMPDRYAKAQSGQDAALWIANRMKALAEQHGRPIVLTMVPTPGYVQESVLVKIPGQNAKLPAVVVGGHMDTYQNQKPGADDDGSGTATVMEVYESILQSRFVFQRDMYFVLYAAEEWGLHGSKAVAKKFVTEKIPVRGVLQFDMTGFKSDKDKEKMFLITDHVNAELTTFLKALITSYVGLKAEEIGETRCGYACSDHASWTAQGFASSFPFESSMGNMNNTLHTAKDTTSLLNLAHAFQYAKLGTSFMIEMAEPVGQHRLIRR
ncbi:MAG: M28 family peptidase [Bdellovibrionales bacterium]|nr:M28 family peptidase [Bdellovibrionales bacterium]